MRLCSYGHVRTQVSALLCESGCTYGHMHMHTCPQVLELLYEAGCLPIKGNAYHTYASALWGVANQAAPVCSLAHGHAHAHAREHVCVCPTYPLRTCSTHTLMHSCPVSILSPCRVCASTQSMQAERER